MSKVMLYGGCVIRDAYSLVQNESKLVRYVARQSLISATAPPVLGLPDPQLASKFQNDMLIGDIRSSFLDRLRNAADTVDLIVVDCQVERLGILDLGDGTFLTPSSEMKNSGLLKTLPNQPAHISLGTQEHTRLYERSVELFAKRLREWGLLHKVLVVDAPWATHDTNGQPFDTYMGRPVREVSNDVSALTRILAKHGMRVTTLPEEHRVGDSKHKWSRGPYHFVSSATEWIAKEIRQSLMPRQLKPQSYPANNTDVATYFYTRFGLGVSDPQWIEYRLRLFQSITLPSVTANLNEHAKWLIYIDERMHQPAKNWLHTITDHPHIQLIPVVSMAQIPYKLKHQLAGVETVRLIRIDDDDAISYDFLESIPPSAGVHTFPRVYEVDIAHRTMRSIRRSFLSLNTVYHGPAKYAEVYARMGHHRIERWATDSGIPVNYVETLSPVCIYSRHKQADSNYPTVHRHIREDKNTVPFDAATRRRFGIDEALFEQWRDFARAAPKLPSGSVWKKSQELNKEAANLLRRLYEINAEVRETTRDLFS